MYGKKKQLACRAEDKMTLLVPITVVMQSIVVFTLELSRNTTLLSQHPTHTFISAKNDFCCTVR